MEKIVEVAEPEVVIDFQPGVKCRATVHIRSVHGSARVAFKVQTSSPHKFLVNPPCGVISPLAAASFQVILKPQPPSSVPRPGSDRFLVKAAVLDDENLPSSADSVVAWFDSQTRTQDVRLRVAYVGGFLLRRAVNEGDAEAVNQIVRRQPCLVPELGPVESGELHRAASANRAVLEVLVQAGLKREVGKGWTPAHSAAAAGAHKALSHLSEEGGELDGRDGEGRTPLHLAAGKGHVKCVRLLLEKGVDGDAQSNDGRTALHRAAAAGDFEMVAVLLDAGVNAALVTHRGRSALDMARDKGHQETVEVLERGEMVLTAARRGDRRQLESLLRKGVGANCRDQYGMTGLHAAAVKGYRDIVRLLAEFGGELEGEDVEGHTPLHLAVEGGCVDTVAALLDLGAEVNAKSHRGATPLFMAKSMGYDAVSQLLLSRGAAASSVASSSPSLSSM